MNFSRSHACIQSERGIALFIVLWALVLLSVIVGEFCFATRSEVNTTFNFKEDTRAYYYARAGINAAIFELLNQAQTLKPDAEAKDEGEAAWHLDGGPTTMPFDAGAFTVIIANECGKVNINQANDKLLRLMVGGFDLSDKEIDTIVDSIVDWRDKDDFHRINGAENDYYQGLEKAYSAKNGDFDFVSELLMVRGITPAIYHGGLKNRVSVWDDPDITEATPFSPIQQYLTLKNRPKSPIQQFLTLENRSKVNTQPAVDYNRIDINSAPAELLRALPGMDDYDVDAVIAARQKTPFTSVASLINIVGSRMYTNINPYLAVQKSKFVTITATGTVENSPIYHTVRVTIKLDADRETGYAIMEWQDSIYERIAGAATDETGT